MMIASADIASIERLLEPLEIGVIPDFEDTHPDKIFDGFNEELDAIIEAQSEPSDWDRQHARQFGNIGVRAIATSHTSSGNLSEHYRERRLRVAVPWVPGEADGAPAEILQFRTTHQVSYRSRRSEPFRAMQLSSGILVPRKPVLEAVGIETVRSPIDTEELLKRSVLSMRARWRTQGESDTTYFYNENETLKRAFGVASAILDRLSDSE